MRCTVAMEKRKENKNGFTTFDELDGFSIFLPSCIYTHEMKGL